ncbi:hypothetical protein HELRODRAFT_171037 [Helobdella robusta]|uniref:Uncharacterized protein n=1 Tax=Helobdella robusta TaxID=6412 RepID=T1F3Q7_HELRO|nr:hypothetical protein HELRODRAFT_171037 [Helobdella robusta]ESO07000.1 hypothetical protein HELRODRAFT_171037 [Helobdella robusta]
MCHENFITVVLKTRFLSHQFFMWNFHGQKYCNVLNEILKHKSWLRYATSGENFLKHVTLAGDALPPNDKYYRAEKKNVPQIFTQHSWKTEINKKKSRRVQISRDQLHQQFLLLVRMA